MQTSRSNSFQSHSYSSLGKKIASNLIALETVNTPSQAEYLAISFDWAQFSWWFKWNQPNRLVESSVACERMRSSVRIKFHRGVNTAIRTIKKKRESTEVKDGKKEPPPSSPLLFTSLRLHSFWNEPRSTFDLWRQGWKFLIFFSSSPNVPISCNIS